MAEIKTKDDLEMRLEDFQRYIADHAGISTSRLIGYIVEFAYALLKCWEELDTHLDMHSIEEEYKED